MTRRLRSATAALFCWLLLISIPSCGVGAGPHDGSSREPAVRAVRLGRLIDPASGAVIERAVVVVRGDRVAYVGDDASQIPAEAPVLDWGGYTGLPGLIDAHTHVTFVTDGAPGTNPFERVDKLGASRALPLIHDCLQRMLRLGVTTAIDKGSPTGLDLKAREAVRAGRVRGPRLVVAGPGVQTDDRSERGVRAEVRRLVALGVDLIKVWADECSDRRLSCQRSYSFEAMRATVDEAHRLGKPVSIHAYHGEVAADAVRAGADALEHAEGLDAATLDEMTRRGTTYVPTIDHNRYYRENAPFFGFSGDDDRAFEAFLGQNLATTSQALARGVAVAMGSDAVFTMCGENKRELAWLVRAGMTPLQALKAATFEAARSVGRERELGRVAPGYFADLIAVEGDPLADIEVVIRNVRGVMQGGEPVDLRPPAAAR
ncbi:MAG TPA: amidohydrolase family protein [Polyangiaceae bacterium]|nr:amidohydrolase family protein [Polyangiaceae bacterium]